METLSRRGVLTWLSASLLSRFRLRAQSSASESAPPAADNRSRGPARTTVRAYRADAVILLLGLAIYRRAGVGSGKASLEETGEGAAQRRTLFFAAGSDPKRARGFSRLGWMREVVLGPIAAPSEISYFGVLTSSPEESLEHARKSAGDAPSGRSTFSAASGRHAAGRSRSAIAHFDYASGAAWFDQGLIDRAQSSFQGAANWRETAWPNYSTTAPPTFLHQLATLFVQRAPRASVRYVYNEQEYLLEVGAQRPARGDENLVRIRGKIRNLRTRSETPFRVWLEDVSGSVLPVRIEFQPRSFLRLTFAAVPA